LPLPSKYHNRWSSEENCCQKQRKIGSNGQLTKTTQIKEEEHEEEAATTSLQQNHATKNDHKLELGQREGVAPTGEEADGANWTGGVGR